MSSRHYIFVQPADSGSDIVADLSAACGEELRRVGAEHVDYVATIGGTTRAELNLSHPFEEDQGIPFERFRAVMEVRDVDRDADRQLAVARRIVRYLADTRRYWVVLVYELQSYIESAAPGATGSQLWPPAKGA
ncbi:hypothetical protein [Kitasatospora aureofaciens]|uniref:hypothetical protein n=1 Tax=Kitasatospora aureofaciens TaxID=1894 RepID=UPI000526F7BD|nr:hypothetical protein [Kitasatospora aureofaciens]